MAPNALFSARKSPRNAKRNIQARKSATRPHIKELSKYLEQVNGNIKDRIDGLRILKDEKTKLELEHKRLYDLYLKEGISVSGFERTAKPIDERLDELEKSIPEAEAQIDILKDNALNEGTLQQEGRNLYDKCDSLSDKEKMSVIQTLTDSIKACEEVEINLRFSPVLVNDGNFYTQPVGLGKPAYLQACFAGP